MSTDNDELRAMLAGLAMLGILININNQASFEDIAGTAVRLADAVLKELNGNGPTPG